jgi:polar amino acid transport system permease protein
LASPPGPLDGSAARGADAVGVPVLDARPDPTPPNAGGFRQFFRRHSAVTASASTLIVLAAIAIGLSTAPGVDRFRAAFLSWKHLHDSAGPIGRAFLTNIKMMLVAEVLVLAFALLIAVVRGLPGAAAFPLRAIAVVYTDFFRGTPLILLAFMIGLGFPALQLRYVSDRSTFFYGVLALVLVYSAYVAEVYRAGIESVHASQDAAARSLGLRYGQSLRFVILPQAIRRVIPPLLNDFIGLQKDTAIISVIGVVESARAAQDYSSETFNFAGYTIAGLYFVLLTIPLTRFTDYLIRRDQRKMRAFGG